MEVLDLRHFTSADLRPLLEDEIRVWADLLCWDYTGSAEMILRYMDAKFLPGYAAVSRGKVFGYSFFVYESNKGVIGDLFVSEGENGMNRQEVETRRSCWPMKLEQRHSPFRPRGSASTRGCS